eukprot:NODE_412_length_3076_cov_4.897253.p1 GENE.NODE_412_length_3076_cov_4.897253~~NODE_412_length_3076_cov_4.897253.p1  ORF type:complete len:426 (-),score=173.66 NODE_412_length_3076_cov_4.897253:864-2141(-)
MVPTLLTTDLCSLRSDVERLCFTVLWEMTPEAEEVGPPIYCKAIIRSRAALSYAEAQARIEDSSDRSEITESLRRLLAITKIIRQRRMDGGALELASQQVNFQIDSETQDPTDIAEYQSRETNKLIEEMMLLANSAVARKILDTFPMSGVLRRHPPAKDDQLKIMKKLLATLGFEFEFASNKELGASLNAATKADDPYFNTLVRTMATKCMNQAVYFCTGEVPNPELHKHYGLAMDKYTHFTSPIRRYADVLVHRLLAAALGLYALPEMMQKRSDIAEQCEKINLKHRNAQFAGRASDELHTFLYFNKMGPQKAEAVVTRIRKSMQVVIQRYGIEGSISLPEDDWEVNEEEQRATNLKDRSIEVRVFAHVIVLIEADNSEFRNRTHIRFERLVVPGENETFEAVEAARKVAQKEMYPERVVREAN